MAVRFHAISLISLLVSSPILNYGGNPGYMVLKAQLAMIIDRQRDIRHNIETYNYEGIHHFEDSPSGISVEIQHMVVTKMNCVFVGRFGWWTVTNWYVTYLIFRRFDFQCGTFQIPEVQKLAKNKHEDTWGLSQPTESFCKGDQNSTHPAWLYFAGSTLVLKIPLRGQKDGGIGLQKQGPIGLEKWHGQSSSQERCLWRKTILMIRDSLSVL